MASRYDVGESFYQIFIFWRLRSIQCEDRKYLDMAAKIKMAKLVLTQRRIQRNILSTHVQFGLHGKLYVEAIKT